MVTGRRGKPQTIKRAPIANQNNPTPRVLSFSPTLSLPYPPPPFSLPLSFHFFQILSPKRQSASKLLIQKQQRPTPKKKTYGRVRDALGAVTLGVPKLVTLKKDESGKNGAKGETPEEKRGQKKKEPKKKKETKKKVTAKKGKAKEVESDDADSASSSVQRLVSCEAFNFASAGCGVPL